MKVVVPSRLIDQAGRVSMKAIHVELQEHLEADVDLRSSAAAMAMQEQNPASDGWRLKVEK